MTCVLVLAGLTWLSPTGAGTILGAAGWLSWCARWLGHWQRDQRVEVLVGVDRRKQGGYYLRPL